MSCVVVFSLLSFVWNLPADVANAQGISGAGSNLEVVAGKAEITESSISNIVGKGINAILSMVGLIFLVLMVYAGILWMTARGDETKVEKAQTIIQASLIGLIVTVSAYAITVFVTKRFVE